MDTGRYDGAILAALVEFPQVPESWVRAVIGAESSYRTITRTWEPAVNEYAYGPMQVLASTGRGLGISEAQLASTETSIRAGVAVLAELIGRWGMDFRRVYSAYNSGRPDRWETSGQVRANVERAEGWLARFQPAAADWGVLALVGILGVLWARAR